MAISPRLRLTLAVPACTAILLTVFLVSNSDASTPNTSGPVAVDTSTSTVTRAGITPEAAPPGVSAGLDGKMDALAVANSLTVANEYPSGYSRDYFNHWVTVDSAGCNARERVLKDESRTFPQVDYPCYVVAGDWYSPYDGVWIRDRGEVDIDHMVPLKEAWDSGAWRWDAATRQRYANDISDSRTLIAVSASSNRSKSDNDPSQWMPRVSSYRCTYLGQWVAIKARWKLTMDASEAGYVKTRLARECPKMRIGQITWPVMGYGGVPVATTLPSGGGIVVTGVQAGQYCKTEHRGLYGLASNGRRVRCYDDGSGYRWHYA